MTIYRSINALAESINGLYKTEVIKRRPWRTLDEVELATAEWVDWYNRRRLHSWCGHQPPIEFENTYYAAHHESPKPIEEHRLTVH